MWWHHHILSGALWQLEHNLDYGSTIWLLQRLASRLGQTRSLFWFSKLGEMSLLIVTVIFVVLVEGLSRSVCWRLSDKLCGSEGKLICNHFLAWCYCRVQGQWISSKCFSGFTLCSFDGACCVLQTLADVCGVLEVVPLDLKDGAEELRGLKVVYSEEEQLQQLLSGQICMINFSGADLMLNLLIVLSTISALHGTLLTDLFTSIRLRALQSENPDTCISMALDCLMLYSCYLTCHHPAFIG